MSLNVPPPPPVRRTDVPAVIPGSGSPSQQLHILVISQPPGSTSNSSGLSRSGNSFQAVHLFPGMTRGCQFQQHQIGKKDSSAHPSACRNVGWRLDEVVGMSATRGPIVYWLIGRRRLMSPIRFEGRESVKRSLSVFLFFFSRMPFSPFLSFSIQLVSSPQKKSNEFSWYVTTPPPRHCSLPKKISG